MADNIPQSLLPNEAISNFDDVSRQAAQDQVLQAPQSSERYTVQLLQNDTDVILPVSQDEADVAIRSGLYSPKSDEEFIVLDKYGARHRVDGANLREVLAGGYTLENAQQRHEREIQEKFGDAEAASAIEGFTRGALSFPALASKGIAQIPGLEGAEFTPDEAMVGMGLDAQEMRDRAEANPIASGLGNLAGMIAGTKGIGVGKAVAATEAKVASRLGIGKTAADIEKTILLDAKKLGLGKKIAATIASKAAGGAVEGAFYGAGELMSEESLGRADVNAENLITAVGMGALLGGTITGGMSLVAETAKAVAPMTKLITSPLSSKVSQQLDTKVSSARLLGITPTQLRKLEIRNPKIVEDIQSYLKDDLKLGLADTAENLAAKNDEIMELAGKGIGNTLDEVDVILKSRPDLRPSAESVWGNVYNKVFKQVDDIFSDATGPGVAKARREATKFLDEIAELQKSGAEFNAAQLQKIKKAQDKLLKYNKEPGKWTLFEDMVYTTRTAIRDEIDLLATNLEMQGMSGPLAKQLKEFNRQYSAASTFGDFIETRALKSGDRQIDFLWMNAARDVALDVSRKLVVLGKLEKAKQFVSNASEKAIKNFVEPTANAIGKTVRQTAVPFSIMQSEFGKRYEDGKYKKPKDVSEAYRNLQDNIVRYEQDPEAFIKRVNRNTASIYGAAPNTSTALDTLAVQAAMFLGSKVPKRTTNTGMLGMLQKPRPPSKLDLAKLERYLNTIENPKSVFTELESGKLTHESAEALRAVYPNMFSQLQDKALEYVGKNPNLPYNKRLQLGILLDIPTDESLIPENVLGLQATFQQPEQQQQPTVTGMQNMDIAGREATDTQDLEDPL